MKRSVAASGVWVPIFVLLAASAPCRAEERPAGKEVLRKVFERFAALKIRSMAHDERLTIETHPIAGGAGGVAMVKEVGPVGARLRYYYKAPNSHAYKTFRDAPLGYRPDDPRRVNAAHLDMDLMEKTLRDYTLELSEDAVRRGRPCYTLNFIPRPGKEDLWRLTWHVDKEKHIPIEERELKLKGDMRGTSRYRELFYGIVNGKLTPTAVRTQTQRAGMPAVFFTRAHFGNFLFNAPISDSVFESDEESPSE